ncbi:MAG: AAA family ATPase [Clostridia bacterium]|nr:AAA family ATPase [Clostridia bacterium]
MSKKSYSDMRCGLLGEHLGHSYSSLIHSELADYSYKLCELEKDALDLFLRDCPLDAFNVTIPYKEAVIPYLDVISDEARSIGAVNTVVNRDGKLFGYNTDYFGFDHMINTTGVEVRGKKALVIGRGGAAKTVRAVLSDRGTREVVLLGSADNTPENIKKHADAEIIVNASPVGMYPKSGVSPISLSSFPSCALVLDLIFNPARTALLIEAETLGIPAANGLSMLVAQAAKAFEYFTGESYTEGAIKRITAKIEKTTSNIILVGMPGCGKSTIGKAVAEKLKREFIDADASFEEMHGISPEECINSFGEERFRELEAQTLKALASKSGIVLATGGGAVTREENYAPLHQNGDIFFIERELSALAKDGRPLSLKTPAEVMYQRRIADYNRFADVTVHNDSTADIIADRIISEFEKIHDK